MGTLLLVTLNVSGSSDQNEANTMSDYLNRINAKKFMISMDRHRPVEKFLDRKASHTFRESMKEYVQDRKEHTLSQMFEVNDNLIDRVMQRKLQKDLGQLFNLKQLL